MNTKCEYISYESTEMFTPITIDYVNGSDKLVPFYSYPVSVEGVKQAIATKQQHPVNRTLLIEVLQEQYAEFKLSDKQQSNLQLLKNENTFTVTTAHQPVIFTGPLYFIYKIVHAIKLTDELKNELPAFDFVPIFYMGSEDADLNELGQTYINGQKISWNTSQTGAVGRMIIDDAFIHLINSIQGQLGVEPFGSQLTEIFKQSYIKGTSVQQATLHLLQLLFQNYGLLVILPDNQKLKSAFLPQIKKELLHSFSNTVVAETLQDLSIHYKQQATGRQINLFYLTDTHRERIEKEGDSFTVKALNLKWTAEQILQEAEQHPERFSPNVILRPLFQETILPNIIFIGGGGENAYWLELKKLFAEVAIPYPLLVLRNSFLLINPKHLTCIQKLQLSASDLFKGKHQLMNSLVARRSTNRLDLNEEKKTLEKIYAVMGGAVANIDATLLQHTVALAHKAMEKVNELEKKMLRAEKRKFEAEERQLNKIFSQLFPKKGLQERSENFSSFYATYGPQWIQMIYEISKGLSQEFTIAEIA